MGIERVGLEDHGDVTILRRHVVDHPVADADFAAIDRLETGDGSQQGRLAAAGRADEHDKLTVRDVEIDRLQHSDRAEFLVDVAQ